MNVNLVAISVIESENGQNIRYRKWKLTQYLLEKVKVFTIFVTESEGGVNICYRKWKFCIKSETWHNIC